MKETNIVIKESKVAIYKVNQYPLIEKDHIKNCDALDEGMVVRLMDDQNRFIGKGYIGYQNKGIGWILSLDSSEQIDALFFEKKIIEAYRKRDEYHLDNGTNAYRLFNGEGDKIGGLTIDYYDGYVVVTWYSKGIFAFESYVLEAIRKLPIKGIYYKKRYNEKGQFVDEPSFMWGQKAPEPLVVLENDIKYHVYLDDGPMTGIFLDQKDVRKRIKDHYGHVKTVLNTFSYTGAFSVAAKMGGAVHTTSVDLAKRSLSKTAEQFAVNGFNPDNEDIVVMDVFNYFKWAIKKQKTFDLVILDPPAFAKSKKLTFSVLKDYTWLIENAIELCNDQGVIVASTNSAKLEIDKFLKAINKGFINKGMNYEIIETYRLPGDFTHDINFSQGNYLKVLFIKIYK